MGNVAKVSVIDQLQEDLMVDLEKIRNDKMTLEKSRQIQDHAMCVIHAEHTKTQMVKHKRYKRG